VSSGDRFQVLVNGGEPIEQSFYDNLTALEVEENADLPGAMEFTAPIAVTGAPGMEDLSVVGDERFKPYGRIAVVVTPEDGPDSCIFDGYVLSHKIQLDRGTTASSARVWAQDVSCLMNLEEQVREFEGTDVDVADTIFRSYGFLSSEENSDSTGAQRTVMQRATDAQFLRDQARKTGKLFRVVCKTEPGQNFGYFARPRTEADPVVTLVLNPPEHANVEQLDITWDVARPTEVIASVLLLSSEATEGGATDSGLATLDSRSLANYVGDEHAMKAMLTTTAASTAELQQHSASLLREAGWFVRCEGEADLARLKKVPRVGDVVRVNGAGEIHSGNYLVWTVRHTITSESHRMSFVLVRNALGTNGVADL